MDRSALAAGSAVLVSLVAAVGCGAKPSPPPDPAPLVLAELQAASPGPWRRGGRAPISMTALDRNADTSYLPPAFPGAIAGDNKLRNAAETALSPQTHAVGKKKPPASKPRRHAPNEKGAGRRLGKPRILAAMAMPGSVAAPQSIDQSAAEPRNPADAPRLTAGIVPLRQQALESIRRGFQLAGEDLPFQARTEFMVALQLVAAANDVRHRTGSCSGALVAATVALAESRDFLPSAAGGHLALARIISGHKTPLLKDAAVGGLTPQVAAKRYEEYAQEQFTVAAAGEVDASMALLGWARAEMAAGADPQRPAEALAQAIVLYQAAAMADPRNYRAANELSDVLAAQGDLPGARDVLIRSIHSSPHPSSHLRLAAVYGKLQPTQWAALAQSPAMVLERDTMRRDVPPAEQDDVRNLARTTGASESVLPSANAAHCDQENVATANRPRAWLPRHPHR